MMAAVKVVTVETMVMTMVPVAPLTHPKPKMLPTALFETEFVLPFPGFQNLQNFQTFL
jgi:hypothetical protein